MNNLIEKINLRRGFDRIYFIFAFVWIFILYSIISFWILDSSVNPYTNDFMNIVLVHILILFSAFILYFFIFLIYKIFLWIIYGFKGSESSIPKLKIISFSNEDSLFGLIKKYRFMFLLMIGSLIFINILISFKFTRYDSFEHKEKTYNDIQLEIGKLPLLPRIYNK